ncbi:MAG: ATP-binding protein [Propionibacteriaceae bacterium]|nr:ATP-binding protein [Propionibacteriaceae bacterium]
MEWVDRPRYSAWLNSYAGTPVVKVLTGVRRSGKSSLLAVTAQRLRQQIAPERVLHLDFDLFENNSLLSAEALHERIAAARPAAGPFAVLLDEIQEVDRWERVVNSLVAEGGADIYLTGSNSKLLSSELGTLLTGRYVTLEVSPLSFAEHLAFTLAATGREPSNRAAEFQRYLRRGGFPGLLAADFDDAQARQIVADIFFSILARDILGRHPIRGGELFERMARFALDNVGNPFSARRVAAYLKAEQRPLSHPTVVDYLGYLTEAFVIRPVPQADLRGKGILALNQKYYAADHGLVNAVLGYNASRLPGLLENIVAVELRRRGYDVRVGQWDGLEVDFVADRQDERLYVQVATTVLEESTRRREYAPLLAIKDSYPKYVVTLDALAGGNTAGVRELTVPDFLLLEEW